MQSNPVSPVRIFWRTALTLWLASTAILLLGSITGLGKDAGLWVAASVAVGASSWPVIVPASLGAAAVAAILTAKGSGPLTMAGSVAGAMLAPLLLLVDWAFAQTVASTQTHVLLALIAIASGATVWTIARRQRNATAPATTSAGPAI